MNLISISCHGRLRAMLPLLVACSVVPIGAPCADTLPWLESGQQVQPPASAPTYAGAPRASERVTCNRSSAGSMVSKQTVGGVIGGVLGGLLGSQVGHKGTGKTVATIGGVLLGAMIGGGIGRSMDAADQECARQALEYAPDHTVVTWNNPDTQTGYEVTPVSTYRTASGSYCRDYVTEAQVAGGSQQVRGKACRQPDGTWRIVE